MKKTNNKTENVYQEIIVDRNGNIEIPYVDLRAVPLINAIWNKLNGKDTVAINISTPRKNRIGE